VTATIQTAVVGSTGYAGFELTRLLSRHPRLGKPLLLRREREDGPANLAELYPHISGNGSYPLEPFSWSKLEGIDLLFMSTPHEISREWVPEAIRRGLRVVDLSGAWRLRQPEHRQIYGFSDAEPQIAATLTETAVYGLPELHGEQLSGAQLVANPGCYATSIILALAPLVRAGVINREAGIICDSKSGVSGAGRQPSQKTHFVEVADNLSAYSVFNHRHTGEILEQLELSEGELIFTPHLLPIPRGILSTIYVRLRRRMQAGEVESCFRNFYSGAKWVRVYPSGKLPQIQFCVHSNFCDVGFCLSPEGERLVIVSCLDNLVKGAAGQAVQNMNLMYGWNETEGLN
jgi:N-acetyl-gamma-glutamyl-phosphate reductase